MKIPYKTFIAAGFITAGLLLVQENDFTVSDNISEKNRGEQTIDLDAEPQYLDILVLVDEPLKEWANSELVNNGYSLVASVNPLNYLNSIINSQISAASEIFEKDTVLHKYLGKKLGFKVSNIETWSFDKGPYDAVPNGFTADDILREMENKYGENPADLVVAVTGYDLWGSPIESKNPMHKGVSVLKSVNGLSNSGEKFSVVNPKIFSENDFGIAQILGYSLNAKRLSKSSKNKGYLMYPRKPNIHDDNDELISINEGNVKLISDYLKSTHSDKF